jgi:uncharacterized protein
MNNKILVISSGAVHPTIRCRFNLQSLLKKSDAGKFTFSSDLKRLADLPNETYSSVVLYFQKKTITDQLLDSLENFVFNGGGLLALHAVSASFKQNQRYFNLLGGRFIHHGKIAPFKVQVNHAQDSFFRGIDSFSITDELYIHEYLKDVAVHFTTQVGKKAEPVVWTRELGKGKVAYCSLGHRAAVWKQPEVKSIINQSLDWLTGAS